MMKRILLMVLVCVLCLCACSYEEALPVPSSAPSPTELPKENVDDIINYFCEVVLRVEYHKGEGNPNVLQKWKALLYYEIEGEATDTDIKTVENFARQLNRIEGFPGMLPAVNAEPNIKITFLNKEEYVPITENIVHGEETDGVSLWTYHNDTNEIYDAQIWIRSDIEQSIRNSVILEEIVNAIGMGGDTVLRPDSIIFQSYSVPDKLSDMDWKLLNILYNEKIVCGMNAEQCSEVIRELYK